MQLCPFSIDFSRYQCTNTAECFFNQPGNMTVAVPLKSEPLTVGADISIFRCWVLILGGTRIPARANLSVVEFIINCNHILLLMSNLPKDGAPDEQTQQA